MDKIGCDIYGFLEVRDRNGVWKFKGKIPGGRDYDWFGVLAGIRNYANVKPIAELRGIPTDISIKLAKKIAYWGGLNGCSCSWLTLKDFSEYDWDCVFVDGRISKVNRKTGEEIWKAISFSIMNTEPDLYEYKYLSRIVGDLIQDDWRRFLDKMELLATKRGLENVRIVFWFDC